MGEAGREKNLSMKHLQSVLRLEWLLGYCVSVHTVFLLKHVHQPAMGKQKKNKKIKKSRRCDLDQILKIKQALLTPVHLSPEIVCSGETLTGNWQRFSRCLCWFVCPFVPREAPGVTWPAFYKVRRL